MLAVLRHSEDSCLFGCGEAAGEDRVHHVLETALRSPLLDRGRLLHDAGRLLVHISGPSSLSMEEVADIMKEISKNLSPSAMLNLGVSVSQDHSSPFQSQSLADAEGRSGPHPQSRPPPISRISPRAPQHLSPRASPNKPRLPFSRCLLRLPYIRQKNRPLRKFNNPCYPSIPSRADVLTRLSLLSSKGRTWMCRHS